MNLPGIDLLGVPLWYLLWFIYRFIGNYFVAIFLFTLLVRAATFPLSIKSQKMQADRARLAPRLERLQKKYAQDRKKLQEKQMKLYEKEGVSMTGGCLPMVVQMIVLFGIIAVIYSPLTHLTRMPEAVVDASLSASAQDTKLVDDKQVEVPDTTKLSSKERGKKYYYRELRLLMVVEYNKDEVITEVSKLSDEQRKNVSATEYYDQMVSLRKDFNFFGKSLLENPWNAKGFAGINVLWLIPLLSWLTAMGSSFISMRVMNASQVTQPGQGCQNNSMLLIMPLMSLFIAFSVPGGVGIYWICSNIIAALQTVILNMMYNPAKIRAQAEIEYEERRKQKQEDKKRLAEARARENAEYTAMNNNGKSDKSDKKGKPGAKSSKPSAKADETPAQLAEDTTVSEQPGEDELDS